MPDAFTLFTFWLVIGLGVTIELRAKGAPIAPGRAWIITLLWPLALLVEAIRRRAD